MAPSTFSWTASSAEWESTMASFMIVLKAPSSTDPCLTGGSAGQRLGVWNMNRVNTLQSFPAYPSTPYDNSHTHRWRFRGIWRLWFITRYQVPISSNVLNQLKQRKERVRACPDVYYIVRHAQLHLRLTLVKKSVCFSCIQRSCHESLNESPKLLQCSTFSGDWIS